MITNVGLSKGLKLVLALMAAFAILPLSVAGAASVGIEPLFAVPPGGTPLYSWGSNASGQLGLGNSGAGTQRTTPTRVGEADNWIQVATAAGGAVALNAEGHIYTWGSGWTAAQMGQGAHPSPGTGNITVPTRMGDRDDWIYVTFSGTSAAAISDAGHLYTWGTNGEGQLGLGDFSSRNVPTRVGGGFNWATVDITQSGVFSHAIAVTTSGHLYTWGANGSSQLGLGVTGGPAQTTPQRVGTYNNWSSVAVGAGHALAINTSGELFAWGNNSQGQLGLGDQGVATNRNVPTRVGTEDNWVDAIGQGLVTAGATLWSVAINSEGHLYTWGGDGGGQLGRPANGAAPANLPGRVGDRSDWVAIGGGNAHSLAMTESFRLYAWGSNSQGQLGIGGAIGGSASTPQFVLQAYGLAGFSQSGAGTHSMALIRTEPLEGALAYLVKRLEKPQGTNILGDMNFNFTFERHSFNDVEAMYTQVPNIPDRTITLNSSSASSTSGLITTTTGSVNVLAGIEFTQPGTYSWLVREAPTTGITSMSNIVDSQAVYELRAYVTQDGGVGGELSILAITVHRLYCDEGYEIDPPLKTNDFWFTNVYSRTTTGPDDYYGALVVSKNVTGQYAPLYTVFNFQVTLTRTAMCPENTTFVGQVYNADGTTSGSPITFTSGSASTVNLTHGQRLVFDEFLVGTRFAVTELAAPLFTASVNLMVDGNPVTVPGNTAPNQALSIGTHIAGDNENSAAFTNAHFYTPPTGLVANNVLIAIPVIAAVGLGLYFVRNYRKGIEELPLV